VQVMRTFSAAAPPKIAVLTSSSTAISPCKMEFGGHHAYLLLIINCNYPMKGYGKNSGTGDATSYHSKRGQTVTNFFSDKEYIA
jgi:hypothetical protein